MTECTGRILLADEDPASRRFIADNLTADGYDVVAVENRDSAIAALQGGRPRLVLADVNGDTLTLLDAIRGADGLASRIAPDTPLIVLTRRRDELARIRYLDRGSDLVLVKPFSYPELRAQVRALLRRAEGTAPGRILRIGQLAIDTVARDVHVGRQRIDVAAKEYALLVHLAGEPSRVYTKQELLRDVWGHRWPTQTRTLDAHAVRLRRKLNAAGGSWVQNVWGVGYRLTPLAPANTRPSAA